ncbi:hypothetical protein HID58_006576, partial [Brassica napus]
PITLPLYTVFCKNNYSLIFGKSLTALLLIVRNKKQQTVEKMEGDGGVRAPSLVELTVEDSEFTVVGRVKGGDEALHDRIRHLVSQVF